MKVVLPIGWSGVIFHLSLSPLLDPRVLDLLRAGAAADLHEPVPAHPGQGTAEAGGAQVPRQGAGLQERHGVRQVPVVEDGHNIRA